MCKEPSSGMRVRSASACTNFDMYDNLYGKYYRKADMYGTLNTFLSDDHADEQDDHLDVSGSDAESVNT
jgi:hypothetical protein